MILSVLLFKEHSAEDEKYALSQLSEEGLQEGLQKKHMHSYQNRWALQIRP